MTAQIRFRDDILVKAVQTWGSDKMVARAARVSTGQDLIPNEKIRGLIRYLLANGHTSPLEHSGLTVRVEAPMFVRDQWVRHRVQSFNIKSLRFSEAEPQFYIPGENRPLYNAGSGAHPDLQYHGSHRETSDLVGDLLRGSYRQAWEGYQYLVNHLDVAEEVARMALPTALYSPFYASASLWNWLDFLSKRIESENNKPQWEIEQAALQVRSILTAAFPVTMEEWAKLD